MKIQQVSKTKIICGNAIWKRDDSAGYEAWTFAAPSHLNLTRFCVKNYEGEIKPDEPFSGWRVVSGGPFTSAGQWANRDDAILNATPWIIAYHKKAAKEKIAKAQKVVKALNLYLKVAK